jgi:hypothetical protein
LNFDLAPSVVATSSSKRHFALSHPTPSTPMSTQTFSPSLHLVSPINGRRSPRFARPSLPRHVLANSPYPLPRSPTSRRCQIVSSRPSGVPNLSPLPNENLPW